MSRHLLTVAGVFITQTAVLVEASTGRVAEVAGGDVASRRSPIAVAESAHHQPLVAMVESALRCARFASAQPVCGAGSSDGLEGVLVPVLGAHEFRRGDGVARPGGGGRPVIG